MLGAIAKGCAGVALFQLGKSLSKRDTRVKINGKYLTYDQKEVTAFVAVTAGVVLLASAIGNVIR